MHNPSNTQKLNRKFSREAAGKIGLNYYNPLTRTLALFTATVKKSSNWGYVVNYFSEAQAS